jgi:hypothetical protein
LTNLEILFGPSLLRYSSDNDLGINVFNNALYPSLHFFACSKPGFPIGISQAFHDSRWY